MARSEAGVEAKDGEVISIARGLICYATVYLSKEHYLFDQKSQGRISRHWICDY
jgi:hypothetical protein